MRLTAVVLHNVSDDTFFGFKPRTSRLHHAHTLEVEADGIQQASDLIWTLANVGSGNQLRLDYPHLSPYAGEVDRYRAQGNRSLSVGDVIVFYEDSRLAGVVSCEMVGWKKVNAHRLPHYVDSNPQAEVSASFTAHQIWAQEKAGRSFG